MYLTAKYLRREPIWKQQALPSLLSNSIMVGHREGTSGGHWQTVMLP